MNGALFIVVCQFVWASPSVSFTFGQRSCRQSVKVGSLSSALENITERLNELFPASETGESVWEGAGEPRADLAPEVIPSLLMRALNQNDFPSADAGLNSMWTFAAGHTKYIFQQNITEFIESAHETADEFPTSFYGSAMHGRSWEVETPIRLVGGNGSTSDAWIATQIIKTVSSDGRMRRWLWELRKNRRPPMLGCWMVETVGSSDRLGKFEPE
mmetsp:Transcript_28699/g.44087  ORF Transcript_28699/g.44087 Transcript_28699/m.44087 type:complete len:215 (+) Transcript_28699:104-748(+)